MGHQIIDSSHSSGAFGALLTTTFISSERLRRSANVDDPYILEFLSKSLQALFWFAVLLF